MPEMTYVGADANDQQFRNTPKLPSMVSAHADCLQMLRTQHLAFYSTQDADSEGLEGKFFVWTPDEIREVLDDDAQADAFMAAYSVTRHGNASTGSAHGFEGKNILEFVGELGQRPALAEARCKLFEAREKRVHPARDAGCRRKRRHPAVSACAETAMQDHRACQDADPLERADVGRFRRGGAGSRPR
jgi:uncharacterized protein YyaL (SSP411 family)